MEKRVTYFGRTEEGIFCQALFGSSGSFEKRAGAPPFADWETGHEIRGYLSSITKDDRKKYAYVLVNALGAGEFFGSNINADYFPWDALAHKGDDYGYKTFLNANAFQHHQNKDPTKGFGVPVLSALNTQMKRVELIVRLDRAKAKIEGADGIITRIEAGEFPDVSMGCKVPYDVCSICSNRSKERDDYCKHMRPTPELRHLYGPNKILPDGRKIFVFNYHPRFFDISFVFIGADKTAKVMAKLASQGGMTCLGDICAIPRGGSSEQPKGRSMIVVPEELSKTAAAEMCCDSCEDIEKLAEAFGSKVASKSKAAELIKSVPSGPFAMKKLPELESLEKDIPSELLTSMAKERTLGEICSSCGVLGIVLKPREFQRVVLVRMGEESLANELDASRSVFKPSASGTDSFPYDPDLMEASLLKILARFVAPRSAYGVPLALRLMKSETSSVKKSLPTDAQVDNPLLAKIGAAYSGYRREVLTKLSQAVEAVRSDPRWRAEILGSDLVNGFSKTANAPLLTLDSVAYMMGAHLNDRGLLCNTAVAEAMAENNKWLFGDHDTA